MSETRCIALVRGSNHEYVNTALCDLVRYAHLTFVDTPKVCDPVFADNVLVQVMSKPLKASCGSAAVVQLENEPGSAIFQLHKIHPPAHVIIVSSKHDIYGDLLENIGVMPDLDFTMPDDGEGSG